MSSRALLLSDERVTELTELHDAVSEQARIEAAGGWVTALRETVRPRLGSVVLPAHGEVSEQSVLLSDQSIQLADRSKPFSDQSKLSTDQSKSLSNQTNPLSNQTKPLPAHTHSIPTQSPSSPTQPVSSNEPLPMIVTGPPSPMTNTMSPPTRSLRRGGNCKYYVNGELEVARSLGDFGFKLGRMRERTWNYPSQRRETMGTKGFVGDVVSNVPFVK